MEKKYKDKGDFEEALECLICSLDIYKQNYKSNHPIIVNTIDEIETLKRNQGKNEEAFKYLIHFLDMYEQDLPSNNIKSLEHSNRIGSKQNEHSKYKEAVEHFGRLLKLRKKLCHRITFQLQILILTLDQY